MQRLPQERLNTWLWLVKWAARFFGGLSILAGALIKVAPSQLGISTAQPYDSTVQLFAGFLFPILLIFVPVLDSIRRWLERKTLWPLVKECLEEFRKQIYPQNRDPMHMHRVTLFKRCPWVFRKDFFKKRGFGWLKVWERSGHTTRNSRTVFYAPNDPDRAEGVAGLAWAWNQIVLREDLPDVSQADVPDDRVQEYAKNSNIPVSYIKERRPPTRALCGIPLEVAGRVWGVLVIDSRQPRLPQQLIEQHYPIAAKFLTRILERL